MSHLYIKTGAFGTFKMNVLKFSSPMSGAISSMQTKTIVQHFPIKANQPDIEFDVIFRNEKEYERFQKYVRATQQNALWAAVPEITLWWPERGINNWSGFIKEFRAGGKRRNYAPQAHFTVDLVESLVSQKTLFHSVASSFWNVVLGKEGLVPMLDDGIRLPTQNLGNIDSGTGGYYNNDTYRDQSGKIQ